MEKVLPIIIICCVGIAAALGYIVLVLARYYMGGKRGRSRRNEFEVEDDTLVVKLGKRRKKK